MQIKLMGLMILEFFLLKIEKRFQFMLIKLLENIYTNHFLIVLKITKIIQLFLNLLILKKRFHLISH